MFIKFKDIEHFKHIKKELTNEFVYFIGKVKLHGTNAGIGYDVTSNELFVQSRQRIITVEDDNYGFAAFVEENKEYFRNTLRDIADSFSAERIIVFGEWAGKGINQGAAICNLNNKVFFVIETYVLDSNSNVICGPFASLTFKVSQELKDRIKFIHDYQLFTIEWDFNSSDSFSAFQEEIDRITQEVEDLCPVANEFGIQGVGEGIVWTSICNRFRFKSKGEKHRTSLSKRETPIKDQSLIDRQLDCFNSCVTKARLEQAVSEVCKGEFSEKYLGDLIKWVIQDVFKEDSDIIESFNFSNKEFAKFGGSYAAKAFKTYFPN